MVVSGGLSGTKSRGQQKDRRDSAKKDVNCDGSSRGCECGKLGTFW